MEIELKEYLDERMDTVIRICDQKHKALDEDREIRGDQLNRLEGNIAELAVLMNGKFTKMYYGVIGILATTVLTLAGIVITLLNH